MQNRVGGQPPFYDPKPSAEGTGKKMSLDNVAQSTVRVNTAHVVLQAKAFVSSHVVCIMCVLLMLLALVCAVWFKGSATCCVGVCLSAGAWRESADRDIRTQQAGRPIRNQMVVVFQCWAAWRSSVAFFFFFFLLLLLRRLLRRHRALT